MTEFPRVERVGDHIVMRQGGAQIVVHVDHIVQFIKTVFTATTGHEFQEDRES